MAAWLEHEARADPVVFGEEMRALLDHVGAFETRASAGDETDRLPQVWPSMHWNV